MTEPVVRTPETFLNRISTVEAREQLVVRLATTKFYERLRESPLLGAVLGESLLEAVRISHELDRAISTGILPSDRSVEDWHTALDQCKADNEPENSPGLLAQGFAAFLLRGLDGNRDYFSQYRVFPGTTNG